MSLDQLRPITKPRVMDLVEQAGLDVSGWAYTTGGKAVAVPAANPAYCYEWCFWDDKRVVLSLWFDNMLLEDGLVLQRVNMRDLRRRIENATHLDAGMRTTLVRRAQAVDSAVQRAFRDKLPVHVIVCDGDKLDLEDLESRDPSKVQRRLLDPSPWRVTAYDYLGTTTGGNTVIVRELPLP